VDRGVSGDRANENRDAVYVLIIDEINRGNIAKIFGEFYFLLEYRGGTCRSGGSRQAKADA
jgi:5-methylcytosine-specific restriction endonuclease McrBC GTP-binding regulatory subunit McrB